ncbi:MAG: hypothetical protein ACPL5F_14175 [Moorellaceae bacterium]
MTGRESPSSGRHPAGSREDGEEKATLRRMLFLGLLMAAAGFLVRQPGYSAGVMAALPVSLGFYRWLSRAVRGDPGVPPGKAQSVFLRRAFIRMGLFLILLFLAGFGGPAFLLGVLSGLILQCLSYMLEALLLLWRRA